MSDILFYGDPHGQFDALQDAVRDRRPAAVVLMGDMDASAPLEDLVSEVLNEGVEVYFIHGNHEGDQSRYYDNLTRSRLAGNSLHGRVVEIAGIRIAGLGGVFRGAVWFPGTDAPRFETKAAFIASLEKQKRWRDGMPLKHRTTIFPEELEALACLRADILVTHEAPSSHRAGFSVLDELAARMGAQLVVHGHHHEDYDAILDNGVQVAGTALARPRYLSDIAPALLPSLYPTMRL